MKKTVKLAASIRTAAQRILEADRILISSHVHPDGDTMGSLLALGLGLLSIDKSVVMVSPDGLPPRYRFLPGSELVLDTWEGRVDLAIAVDCGTIRQLGKFGKLFESTRNTIQVDHHDFADVFGKLLVADPAAAAVGEIIYDLLKVLKVKITPMIATCLLTSIIVDTGAFRFANIRGRTFRICADLLDRGVDLKYLLEEAYWKKSETTVRLEAVSVNQMKFERNGRVVWSYVKHADFKRVNGLASDVDGVADDLRSIDGVKVAALMRENEEGGCRVSLRSEAGINVAKIAQVFGGGGHFNSAGCHMKNTKANRDKLVRILCGVV
ncbi:MAG: bifunctional oligoribonuclease/PAP phosphatase NrnA [Candidatus Omnitrophica bacterium]|jgi:phosphoesterase RecJ-like protein|nr:bifunctional oligoribonuclease/PAP phosphatase NrnA [Candidatus Omnitrophota bacterium]